MVTKTQKNISGTITKLTFGHIGSGANAGNEYVEVELLQTGDRYATKCRVFDAALVERFKNPDAKGSTVGLAIEESDGKTNPRTNKPYVNRHIVAIVPKDAATQAAPIAPAPAPASRPEDARRRMALDPRGDSIERQVAVKAATDLIAAGIMPYIPYTEPEGGGLAMESEHSGFSAWNLWADHIIAWMQGTVQPDPDVE